MSPYLVLLVPELLPWLWVALAVPADFGATDSQTGRIENSSDGTQADAHVQRNQLEITE